LRQETVSDGVVAWFSQTEQFTQRTTELDPDVPPLVDWHFKTLQRSNPQRKESEMEVTVREFMTCRELRMFVTMFEFVHSACLKKFGDS
jgi:hypothetical protein